MEPSGGITEEDVLRQSVEVLTRKKVPLERLSITTLLTMILEDPRLGFTRPELQAWYREAGSQTVFIMYNRVEEAYRLQSDKKV